MSHEDNHAGTQPSNHDQEPGPTADEIGEQIVESYFATAWGTRPLNAEPLEPNDFERPESPANAIYIGGLLKAANILKPLIPQPEQAKPMPRAKIPAEVLERLDEIRELAVKVLGSPRDAEQWFQRPIRFALEGRRPAELLQTLEGCEKVEQLLKNLYS
jgi:hypothetical protein